MEHDWYGQPMRWLQLNLVADDPLHIDVPAWQVYWRDARVEGLTISAAGATAFYPTDVPLHARSPHLGDRDLFGELVTAAKELDIRVLARFEPFFTPPEVAAAHPDWITARNAASPYAPAATSPSFAWFAANRPSPCFNGPYFREFMPAVMTELATRYPIDGFYANGWPFIGGGPPGPMSACDCPSCTASWSARGHDAYPTVADPDDPVWREFVTWVQECYEDVQSAWQRHVKAIRPGLSFVCNLHGSLASGVRWDRFGPLVDLFANDSQSRRTHGPKVRGVMADALWAPSLSAAIVHALTQGKPMCHIVGGWHAGSPKLRRLAREPRELQAMLALIVARGARPWCNVAGGTIYDRRWMEPVREYYRWHAQATPYLRDRRSLAEVGIVWTPRALWPAWSNRELAGAGPSLVAAFQGWQETLLRARTPFDVVPSVHIATADLGQYRVLVVPSGSAVDAPTAAALRRHVAAGGGLILGCGTLHPAHGPAGGETDLADLLGVGMPPGPNGPHPNGYIDVATTRQHSLHAGIGDTDYLPAGTWHAPVVSAVGAGRYQPPLPFLADLAVVEHPPPDDPVIVQHDRCLYLASDLDALHGEAQLPDTRTLLGNCLDVARDGRRPTCEVSGPGIVDVNVWQQRERWTVHLVNLTNPNLYGGPVDELVPVGPQTITLRLGGEPAPAARLLRSGHAVPVEASAEGNITVVVPTIEDFEVVAIDRRQP
jgi:hypothetical protein